MFNTSDCIIDFKQIITEYSFRLTQLEEIEIKIKLYKYIGTNDDKIYFQTSHFMCTPKQMGPYITSRNSENSQEIALERAIGTITSFYEAAIREGLKPSPEWLVENDLYNE